VLLGIIISQNLVTLHIFHPILPHCCIYTSPMPCDSFLHLSDFRLALPILRTSTSSGLAFRRVLGHDVLEVAPQRLNGREFVADLRDFFE
jgi:hypothetical protein